MCWAIGSMDSGCPITPVDATMTWCGRCPPPWPASSHICHATSSPSALQVFALPLLQTASCAIPPAQVPLGDVNGRALDQIARVHRRRRSRNFADNHADVALAAGSCGCRSECRPPEIPSRHIRRPEICSICFSSILYAYRFSPVVSGAPVIRFRHSMAAPGRPLADVDDRLTSSRRSSASTTSFMCSLPAKAFAG